MHQRRKGRTAVFVFVLVTVLLVTFVCASASCKSSSYGEEIMENGFSVRFIDVGEGDCTVVTLPDGKTFMFDVGLSSDKSVKKIKSVLSGLKVNTIDYLVLSHPDEKHTGGLNKLLETYTVGKVYAPKFLFPEEYPEFDVVRSKVGEENIVNPKRYDLILGEDYRFAFLYADNLVKTGASETEKDVVSPIIYLEYAGVRFILTADTTGEVLNSLTTDYKSGVLGRVFKGIGAPVDLTGVDFYKVASHGGASAFSGAFYDLIATKRAVISVGDNYDGHPSSTVLAGLTLANETCEIYRTDVFGTVSVTVGASGNIAIIKER